MRKRLALLMASLFLMVGAVWAQTVAYTVDPTTGSGVPADGKWHQTWTYTTTAENPAKLQLSSNANNMKVDNNLLVLAVGSTSPGTYTLKVPNNYHIVSYSFDFKKYGEYNDGDVTLTIKDTNYTPTAETQTVEVNNVNAYSTSFVLSGENQGIQVSNFVVNIKLVPIEIDLTTDESNPKWYTIKNKRGNVYAAFTGSGTQIKLNSSIENESYLFYFTKGTNGGYKIHNAATSNLCADHSSWNANGIEWYLGENANANHPGISISANADFSGNCWNNSGGKNTHVAYWSADDIGSSWAFEAYDGDLNELKANNATRLQMSTVDGEKHFYYIKNRRQNGKFANYIGAGKRFTQTTASTPGSYWYFVDATADLPAGTEVPVGYVACRIYNAGHNLAVENTNGNMSVNSGVQYPAKIYFIRKHDNRYWDYVIYPHNEAGAGWNDLTGTNVTNHSYNDPGSIWSIEASGKSEDDLKNAAATAKEEALAMINLASLTDYYTYQDAAIATANAAVKDLDVTTDLVTAVSSHLAIESAVGALHANEKNGGPAVGDFIWLSNRHFGGYMSAKDNDDNKIRKLADKTDLATLWQVEAGSVDGSVKLKNVGNGKYIGTIVKDADVLQVDEENAADLTFVNMDGFYGAFQTTGGDTHSFANFNSWYGGRVLGWEKNDDSSQWLINEAYPLTVTYMYDGVEDKDLKVDTYVASGTVYTIENRIEHFGRVITSCKVGEDIVEPVDGAWPTITLTAPTNVVLTLEDEVPGIYVLQSVTLGTDNDKDKVGDTYLNFTPITTTATTAASFQTTPSMLYKYTAGTSFAFQSYNDETVYVGASHNFCVTTERAYWNISQPDADGNVTITRSNDANKYLGHDTNTKANTGLYTNVGSGCNKWKLIPVYPVTINYVCGDKVFDPIEDIVIAGASFTAEINTFNGTLVSCVDEQGDPIEVGEDNILFISEVNAPTTITVTLEGAMSPGTLQIGNWEVKYEPATNGIKLTGVNSGSGALVIPSTCNIDGKDQNVVAISPDFLHGNTDVTSVRFPASLVNLGFRKVEPMFVGSYEGQPGDYGVFDGPTLKEGQGHNRCYIFPNDPHTGEPYVVNEKSAWRLTLDVTITNPEANFNNYGSSIVSTHENSLADSYFGYMQIYMNSGHKNVTVKIDNADDRYRYTLPDAVDDTNNHFKFELEHDGTGGYQVVIYYDDGTAKMYNISASANNTVKDFDRLYYSLPEGIHVDVKLDRLVSEGLFVGCTNLQKIEVDPANPTFKSCEHGVLYDKNGYYVMRIPEGVPAAEGEETPHFDIPSKVVKLYAGAVHGVKADIVLHSNPDIGVVEGHESDVANAKFYLSLDDIDPDETVGGARDFISTNNNTYVGANYKRAPLEEGMYGTICLPFVPTNALDKYDFFEFKYGEVNSFVFSQVASVDDLKVNTPYLYKLKDEPGTMTTENIEGKVYDVFETSKPVTIQTHAKYNPTDEKAGTSRALGTYVNFYIETKNYKDKSAYYYFSTGQQKFLKVTQQLNYRPYRAIFVVNPKDGNTSKAPARLSLCLLDGTTTDIDASLVEGMETPVYYDLSGRRVLNPGSGVYIVNGKKVFIK